jgi:hypothetical protein
MLVKRVRLESLIASGTIPVTLMQRATRMKPRKGGEYSEEDTAAYVKAVGAVVMAVAVDPQVTVDGAGDSIALDSIDFLDQQEIFMEVNRPVAAVQSFPVEPNGSDVAAPDGENLQPAA